MILPKQLLLLTVFITVCLFHHNAQAHKVWIFAVVEEGEIVGETGFGGGRVPKNVAVTVYDDVSAELLNTVNTDEQGRFRLKIPEDAQQRCHGLRLVINVGDGHRGEWSLEADQYPGCAAPKIASDSHPVSAPEEPGVDRQEIQRLVDKAVEEKLAPIRRRLAEEKNRSPGLSEILGGLGFIFGLAALAAFLKSKKKQ
ncbi:MAG: hypothetical protein ABFS19_08655 [Thermodesulfobacteriota bacterium]